MNVRSTAKDSVPGIILQQCNLLNYQVRMAFVEWSMQWLLTRISITTWAQKK